MADHVAPLTWRPHPIRDTSCRGATIAYQAWPLQALGQGLDVATNDSSPCGEESGVGLGDVAPECATARTHLSPAETAYTGFRPLN